jgi:hypothetical protein
MRYVEAVNEYKGKGKSLFLAGAITNAPDWQSEMVALLRDQNLVVFNPRRKNFPINNKNAALEQITWEYKYLRKADGISFWFSKETLNPIVLYELGAWSMTQKPLFIGMDPEYKRRVDVEIQTNLVRPEIHVVYDLRALSGLIRDWASAT